MMRDDGGATGSKLCYFYRTGMLKYLHLYPTAGRIVTTGLKALLAAGFVALLAWQIQSRLHGVSMAAAMRNAWSGFNGWYAVAALLLVGFNWGIEARKWQRMAAALQPVGYTKALQASLYAVCAGFVTPNRLGEWLGKISVFSSGNRMRGVPLSLVSSCAQLLVTLVFGCTALFVLKGSLPGDAHYHTVALSIGLVAIAVLCIYLFVLRGSLSQVHALRNYAWLRNVVHAPRVSTNALVETVLWSALRYMVFTLQFILLLKACGVALPLMQSALLVCVIFFYLTAVPVPTAAEPGLRGNVALFFLSSAIPHPLGIVCAATLLWLVNLALPALAGAAWFLTDKRD
jgi:hypothetical protein